MWYLFFVLMMMVNSQVMVYFYTDGLTENITVPFTCKLIDTVVMCPCEFDDGCGWTFNGGDISSILSLNKNYQHDSAGLYKYGFYINLGITDIKIDPKDCTSITCFNPTISYLLDPDFSTYTVGIHFVSK